MGESEVICQIQKYGRIVLYAKNHSVRSIEVLVID